MHPQVTYTSKPQAAGGPYRSLPGRIIFPGQRPTQSIQVGRHRCLDQCSHCRLAAHDPAPTVAVPLVLVQSGPGALPLRLIVPGPLPHLQPPNVLVNEVSYKTLGFLPGSVKQEGEITPISSDTFEVWLRGRSQRGVE